MSLPGYKRVKPGDTLSAKRYNALEDTAQKGSDAIPNSYRDADGSYSRPGRGRNTAGTEFIRARITASTEVDTPSTNRWTYSWVEVEKAVVGYGTAGVGSWSTKAGGRSGVNDAFNHCENLNDTTGTQGNGVNVDGAGFPANFALQPARVGVVVLLERILFSVSEVNYEEYWFSYESGIDGTCD